MPKLRFHIFLPILKERGFLRIIRWFAKKTLLRSLASSGIGAGDDPLKQLAQQRVELRNPEGLPVNARNLHRSLTFLDSREQQIAVQLLDVRFRWLTQPAPDNGAASTMHLQHMLLSAIAGVSEYLLEYPRHIAHQIYRVIVNDHIPRNVDSLLGLGFFFNDGPGHNKGGF
jgi:hypothetical protein